MGRPKKIFGLKDESVICRLTKEELEKMNFIEQKTGLSKSEILRKGIFMQYNLAKCDVNI